MRFRALSAALATLKRVSAAATTKCGTIVCSPKTPLEMNFTIPNFVSSSCSGFNCVSPSDLFQPASLIPGGGLTGWPVGLVLGWASLRIEHIEMLWWSQRTVTDNLVVTRKATEPCQGKSLWCILPVQLFLAKRGRAASIAQLISWHELVQAGQ